MSAVQCTKVYRKVTLSNRRVVHTYNVVVMLAGGHLYAWCWVGSAVVFVPHLLLGMRILQREVANMSTAPFKIKDLDVTQDKDA